MVLWGLAGVQRLRKSLSGNSGSRTVCSLREGPLYPASRTREGNLASCGEGHLVGGSTGPGPRGGLRQCPTWGQGEPGLRWPQLDLQRGRPGPCSGPDLDCHRARREGEVKLVPLVGDAGDAHACDPGWTHGVKGQASPRDPAGGDSSVRKAGSGPWRPLLGPALTGTR